MQALPIVGLRAFEEPKPVAIPHSAQAPILPCDSSVAVQAGGTEDVVIVVPAQEEGFKAVFLGENRLRLSAFREVNYIKFGISPHIKQSRFQPSRIMPRLRQLSPMAKAESTSLSSQARPKGSARFPLATLRPD